MSDTRELPNPDELTRQPGRLSVGGESEQISPEEAAEEHRAELARANERAAAAEREAREHRQARVDAEARATDAYGNAFTAHERSLIAGIEAQKTLADQAEQALTMAFGAGDPAAIARAQRQLTEATTRLATFEQQKTYFEQQRAQQEAEAKRAPPQQQQPSNRIPVTTPGGVHEVPPSAKEWMDKHPRFYTDRDYYNHAVAAHSSIVGDGIQEGSPAYYRELSQAIQRYENFEAHERGDAPPMNDGLSQRQQMRRAPASSMAAPVSRASAPSRSQNGTLSAHQIAQHIGPGVTEADLREYARINGYKGEEGFQKYLAAQTEVIQLERMGQETGLKTDAMYR